MEYYQKNVVDYSLEVCGPAGVSKCYNKSNTVNNAGNGWQYNSWLWHNWLAAAWRAFRSLWDQLRLLRPRQI